MEKKKGTSVYDIVTERLITELSQGTIPWEKPWVFGGDAPMNYCSREQYKGVNRLLLPKPGEYLTRRQVEACHGTVTRDVKHLVTFFSFKDKPVRKGKDPVRPGDEDEEEVSSDGKTRKVAVFRYYQVYHLDDVEGVPSKVESVSQDGDYLTPDGEGEKVVRDYAARAGGLRVLSVPGDRAAYNAATDTVTVPELRQFENSESYYSVLFHELVHSTGHPARLGRGVGEAAYEDGTFTAEQLTAEIGSAMLMAHCGMDTLKVIRNSAARIRGWVGALSADNRLAVRCARAAEKAVNLILGTSAPATA